MKNQKINNGVDIVNSNFKQICDPWCNWVVDPVSCQHNQTKYTKMVNLANQNLIRFYPFNPLDHAKCTKICLLSGSSINSGMISIGYNQIMDKVNKSLDKSLDQSLDQSQDKSCDKSCAGLSTPFKIAIITIVSLLLFIPLVMFATGHLTPNRPGLIIYISLVILLVLIINFL